MKKENIYLCIYKWLCNISIARVSFAGRLIILANFPNVWNQNYGSVIWFISRALHVIICCGGSVASAPHLSGAPHSLCCAHAWWDVWRGSPHARSTYRMTRSDRDARRCECADGVSGLTCHRTPCRRRDTQTDARQCACARAASNSLWNARTCHRTDMQICWNHGPQNY